ncbi:pyridoxamine 5-phosphate oxidase, partial [Salmonella enterica]|nr:pyridoxamine 5-phosphate oxidase [Salmonella enterica]
MINYPLASSTWDDLEYKAIQSVIDSKMFTMGECVKKYETQFAETFGSKYAVMVSSGSTANLLMIAALFLTKTPKLKKGDEI